MIAGASYNNTIGIRGFLRIRSGIKTIIERIKRFRRVRYKDKLYLSLVQQTTQLERGGAKSLKTKEILTAEQHRSIDDLYSKYVRIRHNSHLFYTSKTGKFQKNYIPDSLWGNYIDTYYNDWNRANHIDNKCYYPRMFAGVKQPRMIAYRLNGFWYDQDSQIIELEKAVCLIMESSECFIKKAENSWGGLGVFFFKPSEHTVDDLLAILNKIPVDLVVQSSIKQSVTLATINNDCVNTVRLLSLLKRDGSVKIYSCILRMGIKGAKVDNASSGGISVGIREDGGLKGIAFSNTGIKYQEHPSTHVRFDEFSIPNFQQMKDIVARLHPQLPHFRLIGWDMACDENDEPVLIEANLCDSELDFHQLNNGPIFGEDTEAILAEVFDK